MQERLAEQLSDELESFLIENDEIALEEFLLRTQQLNEEIETELHHVPQLDTNIELQNFDVIYLRSVIQMQDGSFQVSCNHYIDTYEPWKAKEVMEQYKKEGWKLVKTIKPTK